MKILSEEEEKVVKMDFDLTDDEIKSLIKYADFVMPPTKLEDLKIEWAVNDILEKVVELEVKPIKHTKHIKYRSIENHYLTKHISYCRERFKEELKATKWCAQEKIHGANISFLFQPRQPINHFARRIEIIGNGFYGTGDLFKRYDEKLKSIQEFVDDNDITVRFFGELFGKGIQKGVQYGDEKRIIFFDTMMRDKYISQILSEHFFNDIFNLEDMYVKTLKIFDSLEEALEYKTDFDSTYSEQEDNICEGVVIKPYNTVLQDDIGNLFYLKKKNTKFLEKKQKKLKKQVNVSPEVHKWHEVFLGYIHEQRMESVFSKEGRIDDIRDLGKYIPLIMLDASDTFFKEEEFPVNQFDKKEQKYIFNASKEIVELLKKEL